MGAPVVTTFKAKGQISDHHPLGCGVLGHSGTPVASWFMNESDLLVVFGASFSNHTGIAEYKPIIQVDYDPMALGRFHSVDHPVLGHVGVTARLIREPLPLSSRRSTALPIWPTGGRSGARRNARVPGTRAAPGSTRLLSSGLCQRLRTLTRSSRWMSATTRIRSIGISRWRIIRS